MAYKCDFCGLAFHEGSVWAGQNGRMQGTCPKCQKGTLVSVGNPFAELKKPIMTPPPIAPPPVQPEIPGSSVKSPQINN